MFKFMKKAIAVMTMGAMLIAPSTVFAAETNQDTTKDVVNVKSFCSFLAKKYVGFWQRNLEGEIPSFKSLL